MAVELQDGPLGIEARHRWINQQTSAVLVSLGELTPLGDAPHYHFKITDVVGLDDLIIEDNSEPETEKIGERPLPTRPRGKNVTYSVDVRGLTLQYMRRGYAALRAGFGPDITTGLVTTRSMLITPHPSYGEAEHAYQARCLQFAKGSDKQERGANAVPTAFVRSITIGLKLYDPRIYEWDAESEFGFVNPKW